MSDVADASYVESHKSRPMRRLLRLIPLFDLKPTDHVVDIGCASGRLGKLLHGKVARYTGVDPSPEFIELAARDAAEGVSFKCTSGQDYLRTAKDVDVVFLLDITEHVLDEELTSMLEGARDALAPGGRLYIHTPNLAFVLEQLKDRGFMKQVNGHIAVREIEAYTEPLMRLGLKVRVRYLAHYNPLVRPLHLLSFLPWFRSRIFIEATR